MREEIIGNCRLILGDCRELLPTLGRFDAVVTDPPYGIDWKPRINHADQHEHWRDDMAFDPRPFLSVGHYHLFWGAQYFANLLPIAEGWLTWVKRPLGFDFSNSDRQTTFSTTELAWRDWGKPNFHAQVWDGGMRAGLAANRTFCHPSQKPIELMEWCVRGLPADARMVLDPFMGSGTTGIACIRSGLQFTGIEMDEGYFDIACRRIEAAEREPDIFLSPAIFPVQQELL